MARFFSAIWRGCARVACPAKEVVLSPPNRPFRGNAAMMQLASARRPAAGVPTSAIDPFSLDFRRDPHPAHDALREAGPIVWLDKYGAYAAARHAEVRQILNDPATFCSSRGVGLNDFQREEPWRPPS